MKLTRIINKQEELTILPCPSCNSDSALLVGDCGYTSFNPGIAKCIYCNLEWNLGFVGDQWSAGLKWNKLCREINRKLRLLSLLKPESKLSVSRDYEAENDEFDANQFKDSIRLLIIEGKIC
jgi:hypothetical protein